MNRIAYIILLLDFLVPTYMSLLKRKRNLMKKYSKIIIYNSGRLIGTSNLRKNRLHHSMTCLNVFNDHLFTITYLLLLSI